MSSSFAGIPIRVVRKGTVLYHGTSRAHGFRDLEGPAWVTDSLDTARWFASWKKSPGEIPRILAFEVVRSIPLPRIGAFSQSEWTHFRSAVCARTGVEDDHGDHYELAGYVCALGLNGWNLIGNYQDGGSDIVLCEPSRWLRRIPSRGQWRG